MRVRHWTLALVVALAVGQNFWFVREMLASDRGWRTDFAAAEAEAEREQKPLLVHFSASWCVPCAKMDREVLKSNDVKNLLSDRFICVKVDGDQRPDLMERFSVNLYPTDVIVDPTNGRVLKESQGVRDLRSYLEMAKQGEVLFQRSLAMKADKKTESLLASDQIAQEENPTASPSIPSIELGEPKSLLGVDGFSPVALMKSRKWVRGSAEFRWDYQGVTYQMSSRDELQEFRANPEAYAPRLLGCDPVVLWETDRAVAGRTLFGAFFDDELYFFTSAENRRRFKANPKRFIQTQHVLRIDQIDRTALLDDSAVK